MHYPTNFKAFCKEATLPAQVSRDKRYSPFVTENEIDRHAAIKEFNSGVKPLATAEDNEYVVAIMPSRRMIYVNKSTNVPVAVGKWMDWWEPDHWKFFKVDENRYMELSPVQRATLEAQLQLAKKWPHLEYWSTAASIYYPTEYDRWWWDEGGAEASRTKKFGTTNEYWHQKLEEKL